MRDIRTLCYNGLTANQTLKAKKTFENYSRRYELIAAVNSLYMANLLQPVSGEQLQTHTCALMNDFGLNLAEWYYWQQQFPAENSGVSA